jgi:hypothetical protein
MTTKAMILASSLVALLAGCANGINVYPAASAPIKEGSRYVYYALPRNMISVTFSVKKTTYSKGPCADVAFPKEQLEANDIKIKTGSTVELSEVTITTRAEPDPGHVYAIELTSDMLKNDKYGIELNDQAMLTSASIESTSKVADLAVTLTKTAASTAATILGFGGAIAATPTGRCKTVLDRLTDVRKTKINLLSGAGTYASLTKEALELLFTELRSEQDGLVANFVKREVASGKVLCEYTPTVAPSDSVKLLMYGDDGVTPNLRVNGLECYVPPQFFVAVPIAKAPIAKAPTAKAPTAEAPTAEAPTAEAPTAEAPTAEAPTAPTAKTPTVKTPTAEAPTDKVPNKTVLLKFRVQNIIASQIKTAVPGASPTGIRYRIPARVTLTVSRTGAQAREEALATERLAIAQFGVVAALPGDAQVKSAAFNYMAKLDPTTGALVSYSGGHSAFDPALAEGVGGAAKTVLDAEKQRQDRRNAQDMKALEEEKKRLELERDIKKLRTEVESP